MLCQVPEGRVLPCEAERVVQLPQGPGPGNEPFEGHRRLGQEMIMERYVWTCQALVVPSDWLEKMITQWKKKLGCDDKKVKTMVLYRYIHRVQSNICLRKICYFKMYL